MGPGLAVYWTYPGSWFLCVSEVVGMSDELRKRVRAAVAGSGGEVASVRPGDLAPWSFSDVAQTTVVQAEPSILLRLLEPWRLVEIRDSH